MSRTLSTAAVRAVISRETDQVFLALVKLEHPSISTVRIVANSEQVVRADGTYLPFPFEFVLPDDMEAEIPRASIKFDNVSREILAAIRELEGKPKCTFMLVLADSPDTVEYGPAEFELSAAGWDVLSVTASLAYQEEIWNQQVPGQTYTPSNSPGLFR